jgi:protein SCO1
MVYRLAFLLLFAIRAATAAKTIEVEGMVLRVDQPGRTVLVSHTAVAGYMPGMVMPFRVLKGTKLEGLTPGVLVDFRLTVNRRGSYVSGFKLHNTRATFVAPDSGRQIPVPLIEGRVSIGSSVPDFVLTDQTGAPWDLRDSRGKVVVLTFIYTRCPLPDICPRLSANFAALQKRFTDALGRDLQLLSVTIDPQYDTPEVLSRYAKIWRANPAGWRLLTGDLDTIRTIARTFGTSYWPDNGLLTHTLEVAIIGRDGRLSAVVEGNSYGLSQLIDLVATQLDHE